MLFNQQEEQELKYFIFHCMTPAGSCNLQLTTAHFQKKRYLAWDTLKTTRQSSHSVETGEYRPPETHNPIRYVYLRLIISRIRVLLAGLGLSDDCWANCQFA